MSEPAKPQLVVVDGGRRRLSVGVGALLDQARVLLDQTKETPVDKCEVNIQFPCLTRQTDDGQAYTSTVPLLNLTATRPTLQEARLAVQQEIGVLMQDLVARVQEGRWQAPAWRKIHEAAPPEEGHYWVITRESPEPLIALVANPGREYAQVGPDDAELIVAWAPIMAAPVPPAEPLQ